MNPPRIIVRPGGKTITVQPKGPNGKSQPAPQQPQILNNNKPLITKCIELVIDDIKRLFGKDRKSVENKMIHNDFMEQYFGKDRK